MEKRKPNGVYKILEDVSFRIILKDRAWELKKREQQNKETLILKWEGRELKHLLHTSTRGSGKFQAEPGWLFFKNVLLTCNSLPWLVDFLDLLRYGLESKKR